MHKMPRNAVNAAAPIFKPNDATSRLDQMAAPGQTHDTDTDNCSPNKALCLKSSPGYDLYLAFGLLIYERYGNLVVPQVLDV